MEEQKLENVSQEIKNKRYLKMLFSMFKKREQTFYSNEKTHFNGTEIRLIGEILSAEDEGKRLISTRLAEILGITRSAVSQIVNKLEMEGVVRRVADDVDRKIAYIEVTEEALDHYGEDLRLCMDYVGGIVKRFGEKKFEMMYSLIEEFTALMEKDKENLTEVRNHFLKN